MTQIKHISSKEMRRRTGTNALGYSYPDEDTILLRKGLTGKLKREVLDHEIDHMENGEEGPFLGMLATGIGALTGLGKMSQADRNREMQERQLRESRGDLAPYREFGAGELTGFQDWLGSEAGQYRDPTMEEVQAGPGYASRLGAIESSAAARGGLLSGNALRDIGEFGSAEFGRAREQRRGDYMDEYNRRMGRVNLGYGAAGGSAGLTSAATPGMSGTYTAGANAMGDIGSSITGGIGAYQGQKQWGDYMDRAYPRG
jgi:hypothetical protein